MDETPPPRTPLSPTDLMNRAWNDRPDVRALRASRAAADAGLTQAHREAFPDISLGLAYTHSNFTVSGDNPNQLSVTLSLPLPIFDRNQAAIGKANLELKKADNEEKKLALTVAHEVNDAVRHELHARKLVDAYEGGMLARATETLQIAEKSYAAGSTSLLELLEAQRTYIETRSDYLKAVNQLWQARVDIAHAVNGEVR
jgi:cobalt-zinc-cadmium efflux system outer membrane protein